MVATLASIAALLMGALIMLLGSSLLGIVLPLRMSAAGFSTEVTGIIMGAYFAGLLAGSIYGKRVIGEVGHIRAFAGFAAIMAAAALAYPMQVGTLSWGLLRFIGGFCTAGVFAAIESWLNERSSNETRGRVLSIYMVNNYLGIMLGQFMINLWDIGTAEVFMMASLLTSLSLVPVVLTRVAAPDISQIKPLSLAALYRASPLGVIGSLASGTVLGGYYGLGAIFAEQIGFSIFEVSLFMGSVILGGLLLQWPIGRVSDRYDRRRVLLVVLLLLLAACGAGSAILLMAEIFPLMLGIGLLLGGTMMCIYPIAVSQAYDHLTPDRYVGASSGLLLAYSLGATAGPVLCGFAMARLGPQAFFGFIVAVALLLVAFVLYRLRAREAVPLEERETVVPLPRMSPVVAELDPRAAPSAGTADEPPRSGASLE
ncbi:MAG: MFS transporter [Kiloniellales bacterium]